MTTTLCATPYAGGEFFYFSYFEEFQLKADASGFEEFEIQFIDGSDDAAAFARVVPVHQGNVGEWLEHLERFEAFDNYEQVALCWLLDDGVVTTLDEALEKYVDVQVTEGTVKDYVYEIADDLMCDWDDTARRYFDHDAYARDLELNGEVCEFEYQGTRYTITNCNAL
jgi:antirestriction protein